MQSYDLKAIIIGAQVRAARALLRWSAEDLAAKTKIGVATIRRAETTDGQLSTTESNQLAIRRAFEDAGVIFIDENGEGPGVRLRKNASAT
jgi:ribosome-binding protein aMBF1 (putative translation factor)